MKQSFEPDRREIERNEAARELAKKPKAVLWALIRRVEDLAEKATRAPGGSVMSTSQGHVNEVAAEEIIDWIDSLTDDGMRALREAP